MADLSINMLPVSDGLTDDGLLVVYQNNEAQSIRGELIKRYARESTQAYVEAAQNAAAQAEQAAKDAQAAADSVACVTEKAEEAAQAALAAQQAKEAAETARQAAEQAAALAAQQAAQDVESALLEYLTQAEQARDDAQGAAQTAANETAAAVEADMKGYVSEAQAAKAAAEQAKSDAESAAETAAGEATNLVDTQLAQYVADAQAAKIAAEAARDEAQAFAGGDFLDRPTYDPQGRKQDIFAYVDDIAKGKVSVADIIDNLTTNVANKPLSAAQGVALKALIDALTTTVSGKAPTSHASSTTTYGAGSGSNYGHVKLSDSTSGTSNANGGVAATPAAVKAAYDLANGKAAASHNQAASTITAGTFAGQVVANGSGQTPGTSLLRNSRLVSADTNPTVNGEICWTYK